MRQPEQGQYFSSTFAVRYVAYSKPDLAVMEFRFKENTGPPPNLLPWRDNVVPSPKEHIMVVGYPGGFISPAKEGHSGVLGEVGTVVGGRSDGLDTFVSGLASGGVSGSPAVMIRNGDLFVAGVVFGKNVLEIEEWQTYIIHMNLLRVRSLIDSLKKK